MSEVQLGAALKQAFETAIKKFGLANFKATSMFGSDKQSSLSKAA